MLFTERNSLVSDEQACAGICHDRLFVGCRHYELRRQAVFGQQAAQEIRRRARCRIYRDLRDVFNPTSMSENNAVNRSVSTDCDTIDDIVNRIA